MKKVFVLSLLFVFTIINSYSQHQNNSERSFLKNLNSEPGQRGTFLYTLSILSEPYTDLTGAISVNNDEVWDEPTYVIPVSFPFMLNGNSISYLEFYGSGSLLRSETADPSIYALVFPFEADLVDRGYVDDISLSPISYKVEGAMGNRIMKIEWKNAGSYYEMADLGTLDMYINFQLWLYEGSNTIEFRFGENLIPAPDVFYDGYLFMGSTDANLDEFTFSNSHFFDGTTDLPYLSASDVTIEGTPAPAPETVYRLSLGDPLAVEVTGMNSTSFCNPNGTATAIASDGTPPYNYLWSNGDITATITNLEGDTYTVTVTDDIGEMVSASITITGIDPMLLDVISTDETSVNANDGTATVDPSGGSPPYTYLWSNGETIASITDLAPGTYTITVTDDEGCTASENVTINSFECQGLEIEAMIINASCSTFCDGIIDITVLGGSGPYTYVWSNGLATEDAFDLCAGDYEVTVMDVNGCVVMQSFTITEPPALVASGGSTNETNANANDGTAWIIPTGGTPLYTYAWSNGGTDSLITNLSPGIYAVTVTDENGCTVSSSFEVTEFLCTGMTENFIQRISCTDSCSWIISSFVIEGGSGPFVYSWSTGDTTSTLDGLCPGTYSVTIVDQSQGCTYTESFDILSPEPLDFVIDEIIHLTDSTTTAISITVTTPSPIITFLWMGPNFYTSFDEDISGIEPGLYSVVITTQWGCFIVDSIEVRDETVGINPLVEVEVRLFPNPAKDEVHIDIDDITDFRIQLISIDGRVIQNWHEKKTIEVGSIPGGIYILEGIAGNKVFRERIIITD